MNKTNKIAGIAFVSFLASLAGIAVSIMLLKEDVLSTAHTLFEYFPSKYNVTPAETLTGALTLGIFISILQIISASVAFSDKFSILIRAGSAFVLLASGWFDNWTDVVFRSGYLTGNVRVATITTLAFYTFGSEIAQGLSWLVLVNLWRPAISDVMWGVAKFNAGLQSISGEWKRFVRAAQNKEQQERGSGEEKKSPQYKPTFPPVTPFKNKEQPPQYKPQYKPVFRPKDHRGE